MVPVRRARAGQHRLGDDGADVSVEYLLCGRERAGLTAPAPVGRRQAALEHGQVTEKSGPQSTVSYPSDVCAIRWRGPIGVHALPAHVMADSLEAVVLAVRSLVP